MFKVREQVQAGPVEEPESSNGYASFLYIRKIVFCTIIKLKFRPRNALLFQWQGHILSSVSGLGDIVTTSLENKICHHPSSDHKSSHSSDKKKALIPSWAYPSFIPLSHQFKVNDLIKAGFQRYSL